MKTVKKLKEENHKIRFLTKKEEINLFEALPDHLINIVDCALKTGMRKTEILKLKWENVV